MRFAIYTLLSLLICVNAGALTQFVQAKGKNLIGPAGKNLLLRGTNLGNWFEPEGYMLLLDHGAASPREIEKLFNELIGPSAADSFWTEYRKQYITKADIDYIRNAGFNSIRIPIHYKFFLSDNSEGFQLLDQVVDWARQDGLWVILDLHCAPSGQTGTNIDDSWGYPWLFESPRDQALTIELWTRIAKHYRDEPAVLGYDLLNEPLPPFPQLAKYASSLEPLYRRITAAIRQVDGHHLIILEGSEWDSNFQVFGPPFAENLVYSFHKYWMTPTKQVLQPFLDFRDRYNVPIWLGESGENSDDWIREFVAVLESNGVGWCFWPYKKMENHSGVVTFEKPVYWDEIVSYAGVPGTSASTEARLARRPAVEHSRMALEDLLEKIQFRNCAVNASYLKALGLSNPTHEQITQNISHDHDISHDHKLESDRSSQKCRHLQNGDRPPNE